MALTVSVTHEGVVGDRLVKTGTITFDSSYPAGGEPFDKEDIGLYVLDRLVVDPQDGFIFEWDSTNEKIIVRESGTASAALDEQDAATDLSTVVTTFQATGL